MINIDSTRYNRSLRPFVAVSFFLLPPLSPTSLLPSPLLPSP
ncbi:hypothetical protein MYAER_3016 [Microcystis aeruginosa NIES-2549]|uniref:Uncharacterized protein n=1 Tax=Microcystis aeruginosa NIES-2549 TaxID=1641812 RepID=A0A0F6U5A3_MICAE|nr:hypothetical protein MYAER_3016 [Microcystis aeruginosa NIES-2549]